nr:hypothetical protein [Legionella jordanis]
MNRKKSITETVHSKEHEVDEGTSSIKMDDISNSSSLVLSDLPPEVFMMHMNCFLSNVSKARLSLTSSKFCQFFKDDFKKEKAAVAKLNSHILRGEEKEALSMIETCPDRLSTRATAMDYSGRIFREVTPFQAALLSHDVVLWKKMEPYFDTIPDGLAEKARQFKKLFPNGLPKQKPYDFSALIQIITKSPNKDILALLDNPFDFTSPLGQAIKVFRENFTALSMKETFFNPQHLIESLKIYDEQFYLWSGNQLYLLFSQVIGFTQRFLPAYYAQGYCQRLDTLIEGTKPFLRTLIFEKSTWFPLPSSTGLGFDIGAWDYSGGHVGLKRYVEQIHQNYLDLGVACSVPDHPPLAATLRETLSQCTIS